MKPFLFIIATLLPFVISANNPLEIAENNNKFAFSLYKEIKGDAGNNLFFSPLSISTAMAMVYAGARTETALQISQTMNFPAGEKFHSDYRKLLKMLDEGTEGKIKLNIANGLWAQKDFKFLDSYFDIARLNYNSELRNVDFIDAVERETVRKEINSWVEQKTNDKIKNLLGRSDLNSLTRLVLVNAIYFYGNWENPFKKEGTRPKDFILMDGGRINVPFMNQKERYRYYEDSSIQAIEIPYKENKASMILFLPATNNGLTGFEKSFNYQYYQEITEGLQFTEVLFSLPKFQTTDKIRLGTTLSRMGMPLALSKDFADFSGMTGKRDLCISEVIHQAFINVDEKGTEAAAATAVIMEYTAAPPSSLIKVFNADHPFIFCIRDNTTGSILFMGRIMKPGVPE